MEAYIIGGYRTAVGKANRGGFRFTRPDDLAAAVIKQIMKDHPGIDKEEIDDVAVGNAMPEAEQGLNVGRLISIMGLDTVNIPGMTINRYCSSGIEAIAIASSKIHSGLADCIIAGGTESMSLIPMGGWRVVPNARVAKQNPGWYWGMGLTAEEVSKRYDITREMQDEFSLKSHQKAIKAIDSGKFKDEILPFEVTEVSVKDNKRVERKYIVDTDEGPRRDTNAEVLSKLRPVFANKGTVTAGNSSQTSDGAAFVMVVSPEFMKKHNLKPIARLVNYAAVGVEPQIMGMGPSKAVPKVLKKAGLKLKDIDLVELNEAFASQSVAVIKNLGLDPDIVNVNGGAIALGHPLGCTGAKLTIQMINELRKRKKKYGIVTMCVGTGQGAAGIIELM